MDGSGTPLEKAKKRHRATSSTGEQPKPWPNQDEGQHAKPVPTTGALATGAMCSADDATPSQNDRDRSTSAPMKRRKVSAERASAPRPPTPVLPMSYENLPSVPRRKRPASGNQGQPTSSSSSRTTTKTRQRSPGVFSRREARSPGRASDRDERRQMRSPSPRRRPRSSARLGSRERRRSRSRRPPGRARSPARPGLREGRRKRSASQRRRASSPARHGSREQRPDGRTTERPHRPSPSPPPPSPPREGSPTARKRKRPGGASRISEAEKDALRKKQDERDERQARDAQRDAAVRATEEVVRDHYNAVPERGREWRKTDSTIRGLRSFNNWVKSTIIQKFSPSQGNRPGHEEDAGWAGSTETNGPDPDPSPRLLVLDLGCGKGGDLGKWQQSFQPVELYVGVDPADVSIEQARERYRQMRRGGGHHHHRGRPRAGPGPTFHAEFFVKDAFGEWLGDVPFIREIGIDGGPVGSRWGRGGFDVVSMMFCMHYAFESEAKARGMLRNVAGSLKKGGRFIGVIPNSDVLSAKVVEEHHRRRQRRTSAAGQDDTGDQPSGRPTTTSEDRSDAAHHPTQAEKGDESKGNRMALEWGNSIYRVEFPGPLPGEDGIFRPPFGWRYNYFLQEAVQGVPEYVVPWEAFRA